MLGNPRSQEVTLPADHRSTAKLKTLSAIAFVIIVAVVLIPRLSPGELLPGAWVQTAEARPSQARSAQNVPNTAKNAEGVDILSDTQGVNFNPYLKEILPAMRNRWVTFLPEQARPPTSAKGETDIRFTILPDGSLGPQSMHLDASTHNVALDRAAWGAVTSSKFPPLPKDFNRPDLELWVRFRVNLGADERIPVPARGPAQPSPAPVN